jgi:hypothetical protein
VSDDRDSNVAPRPGDIVGPSRPTRLKCPYCTSEAELVTGAVIYPRRPDLSHKLFWRCAPCGAYVGCHPGTSNPLGRLANASLRQVRVNAHAWFDQIWRNKDMSRSKAYGWLAKQLGIPKEDTHIGMFDEETCRRTIAACMERGKRKTA